MRGLIQELRPNAAVGSVGEFLFAPFVDEPRDVPGFLEVLARRLEREAVLAD